jgi:hypothetical protein
MMDAIEFVKQLRRMNEQGVPKNRFIYPCTGQETDSPEEVVAEVEEWAKDHPIKTRQSVFLKQWPEANIDDLGVLKVCPSPISTSHRNAHGGCTYSGGKCSDCRREFWMQEVEE